MNEAVSFLQLVVTAMVPFILAAQGTMLAGRAGVFNVAQEGVMMLGASVGFLVSLKIGGNPSACSSPRSSARRSGGSSAGSPRGSASTSSSSGSRSSSPPPASRRCSTRWSSASR